MLFKLDQNLICYNTQVKERLFIPLQEVEDLPYVADEMCKLLQQPCNRDIADEFPQTVRKYGTSPEQALQHFEEAQDICQIGERELFIIFLGRQVVGLSLVTKLPAVPDIIPLSWPNLSGYIAHPYRGQGLGRFSLENRLNIVDEHFGGHAWTLVRDTNTASQRLVTSVGLARVKAPEIIGHDLFTYTRNI